MSALKLQVRPTAGAAQDSEPKKAEFASILDGFLQSVGDSTIQGAAKQILDLIPDTENAPTSDETYYFASVCVSFAKQIPFDHVAQARLARLLRYLAGSPKFLSKVTDPSGAELGMVRSHQILGEVIRENLSAATTSSHEIAMQWVNYHSFIARLEGYGVWPFDPTYTIWMMRDGLEVKPTGQDGQQQQNQLYNVMAAAQYILHNGPTVFDYFTHPEPVAGGNKASWRLADEHGDQAALVSPQRWQSWREALERKAQAVNPHSQAAKLCADLAGKTAEVMRTLEASNKIELVKH